MKTIDIMKGKIGRTAEWFEVKREELVQQEKQIREVNKMIENLSIIYGWNGSVINQGLNTYNFTIDSTNPNITHQGFMLDFKTLKKETAEDIVKAWIELDKNAPGDDERNVRTEYRALIDRAKKLLD